MAFKVPQLQRDMMYYDAPTAPPPPPKATKPITINGYNNLEHTQTPNGWICRVAIQQPDSYRFLFYKWISEEVNCRIEMKLQRNGNLLYDPHTFNSDEYHTIYVSNEAHTEWINMGRITKTTITNKAIFLREIEKICENRKDILLKKTYDSLPWYKKPFFKTLKFK
jgi:hypothetical protein